MHSFHLGYRNRKNFRSSSVTWLSKWFGWHCLYRESHLHGQGKWPLCNIMTATEITDRYMCLERAQEVDSSTSSVESSWVLSISKNGDPTTSPNHDQLHQGIQASTTAWFSYDLGAWRPKRHMEVALAKIKKHCLPPIFTAVYLLLKL